MRKGAEIGFQPGLELKKLVSLASPHNWGGSRHECFLPVSLVGGRPAMHSPLEPTPAPCRGEAGREQTCVLAGLWWRLCGN